MRTVPIPSNASAPAHEPAEEKQRTRYCSDPTVDELIRSARDYPRERGGPLKTEAELWTRYPGYNRKLSAEAYQEKVRWEATFRELAAHGIRVRWSHTEEIFRDGTFVGYQTKLFFYWDAPS